MESSSFLRFRQKIQIQGKLLSDFYYFMIFTKFKFYDLISVGSHLARTSRTKDTTCYILRSRWFFSDQGSRKSSNSSSIYHGRTISRRSNNRTFAIGKRLKAFELLWPLSKYRIRISSITHVFSSFWWIFKISQNVIVKIQKTHEYLLIVRSMLLFTWHQPTKSQIWPCSNLFEWLLTNQKIHALKVSIFIGKDCIAILYVRVFEFQTIDWNWIGLVFESDMISWENEYRRISLFSKLYSNILSNIFSLRNPNSDMRHLTTRFWGSWKDFTLPIGRLRFGRICPKITRGNNPSQ